MYEEEDADVDADDGPLFQPEDVGVGWGGGERPLALLLLWYPDDDPDEDDDEEEYEDCLRLVGW